MTAAEGTAATLLSGGCGIPALEKAGLPVGTISGNYRKVADNPSKWEWVTHEEMMRHAGSNDRRAYLANKAQLITGIKELPANSGNYLSLGKKKLADMQREAHRRNIVCRINKCRVTAVNQTHIFKDKNSIANQTMRVRALPFVFPIIEKYGKRGLKTVRGDSEFQEIVGKADLTDRNGVKKRCAVTVIVVRNRKTNRQSLTQLSVFVVDNKVVKSFDTDGLPTSRLVRNDSNLPSSKDSHLSACRRNIPQSGGSVKESWWCWFDSSGRFFIRKDILEAFALEKAGLPVGTVRVWKGKRYIKTAPGKWKLQTGGNAEVVGNDKYRREIKMLLAPVKNRDLINDETGIKARIASEGINKMTSGAAIKKTIANGFSGEDHFAAVKNIVWLWRNAEFITRHSDKSGAKNVMINRFVSQGKTKDGKPYDALITVKETVENGNRIYSLELDELNRASLRWGVKNNETQSNQGKAPTGSSKNIIPRSGKSVKKSWWCWFDGDGRLWFRKSALKALKGRE